MTSRCDTVDAVLHETINGMKADIAHLNTAIGNLTAKVGENPSTPLSPANPWRFVRRNRSSSIAAKRLKGADGDAIPTDPKLQSSKGTRAATGSIQTVNVNNEPLVWVYLSAFHPSTSNEQIAALTRECIGLSDKDVVKVTKLVSKDADLKNMSYVTFKVGVEMRFKTTALSSESWPDNVSFREFVNNGSRNIPNIVNLPGNTTNESTAALSESDGHRTERSSMDTSS